MTSVDVLIVAALPEEYAEARAVGSALAPNAEWQRHLRDAADPYETIEIKNSAGAVLTVALARPTRMGGRSTSTTATALADHLNPQCLAMCGVCAGNPGVVGLGDVVVAELAYEYDEGKRTATTFLGDHRQIPLDDHWLREAQDFSPVGLPSFGRAGRQEAKLWFLERLRAGDEPRAHPARTRYFPEQTWATWTAEMRTDGMIVWGGQGWELTEEGRDYIERTLYDDVDGPVRLPFAVAVAPMASSSGVVKDGLTWDLLAQLGVRTVGALEMEAATIATVARHRRIRHWLVAKGVMDHADPRKDDRYKTFAARASAEVLFALLIRLVSPADGAAEPDPASSSDDLATVLQRRSGARRAVRLQAFGLDETILASYFDQIEVPNLPAGGVGVVEGDFGSGKSETAETWHRVGIKNLVVGDDAPLPVWVNARELLGQTLESSIDQQVGPAWRHGRGACVAIDGLDETDPSTAQALLEAARILAMTFAKVSILLTARPGILSPTEREKVTAPLLTQDKALELVALVSGEPHGTWRWTADMRATVTRPFFALAAGVELSRNAAVRGEADLIRGLVETALAKGTERSAVTSAETRSILESLAVALTRTARDGLSFSSRQIARSSRLIADGPDGSVRFSLPILQHWFAAQAILAGNVRAAEVVADAPSFNRWRWAAAVAVLSAQDAEAADGLMAAWVAGNPGAAAWIVKEAFGLHRNWRADDDENLDSETSGARFLRSLRTWTEALGPLANGVLPAPVVQGPVALGVKVSGRRIDVAFSSSRPAADHWTEVPPGVHPLARTVPPGWQPWFSGKVAPGHAWPWILVRDMITKETLTKLNLDPFLGAPDGIWAQERRFDLARRLLGRGSLVYGALPADKVRDQAEKLFIAAGRDRQAAMAIKGSAVYSGGELEDLVSWIDSTGSVEVVSHLPERDIPLPASGWVWDFYSPQRLMEFEVEVYGRACEAYDEARAHSFSRLGWSMQSSALAPFGVALEVRFAGAGRHGGIPIPGLAMMRVPMELMAAIAGAESEAVWSVSGRAVITRPTRDPELDYGRHMDVEESIRSWFAQKNGGPARGLSLTHTGADDMSKVRPASNVAAQWLWNDLKFLGLGSGTFPQLK